MKAVKATVGARGIDSEPFSSNADAAHCEALKEKGIDFVILYLGSVSPQSLMNIYAAGLAFMPVTYANRFDGPTTVKQCEALGLPKGVTVWLDIEGTPIMDPPMTPQQLITKVNDWATAVAAAGFEPGLYVGAPQPLTSDELYNLKVLRYWKAPSRVTDRNGKNAEPTCGFTMYQLWDSVSWAGVWSDVDFIQKDYLNRLPTWATA